MNNNFSHVPAQAGRGFARHKKLKVESTVWHKTWCKREL